MRPNQSGSRNGNGGREGGREGGKKFVHFPFPSLRFSLSFSFQPPSPPSIVPHLDELSGGGGGIGVGVVVIVAAEGGRKGLPSQSVSQAISSLSLPSLRHQVRIRYDGGREGRRTNACAQVSCPNTLRPDRRSRDDEDDEGTHIERASERVGCDRKGR